MSSSFGVSLCVLVLLTFKTTIGALSHDEYHEELFIKPLENYIYTYFQFTTIVKTELTNNSFDHCHLFPRTLGELIQRHKVQELHVSLTKGLWRYETWGYPVKSAPPGAEVWAWFRPDTTEIDKKWKELTGALSGLLCSSLNFIDAQNTISPRMSLRPSGTLKNRQMPHLMYSTLPREIVCTENLTPWKKLLPCNLKKGLSALLNSDRIYNTVYHSLGIHFRPICLDDACETAAVELVQTVSLVYDLVVMGLNKISWSVNRLFGQGLGPSCPLAASSRIYVDVTSNETSNVFTLRPNFERIQNTRGIYTTNLAMFDMDKLSTRGLYNIEATYVNKKRMHPVNVPPLIYASRFITGYGQEFGGITTKIHNKHWQNIDIILLENIPWFVPTYLKSLKITSGGKEIEPIVKEYWPGKERSRPYYLELMIRLPPRSVTSVSIEFDYAFLKWQEYPPDANHGFYMGAAVITTALPTSRNYTAPPRDKSLFAHGIQASRSNYPVRITTEVLIISLPTPDFSMPYNVICLACTVVALAFGPLHNITTKKFAVVKNSEKKGRLTRLVSLVMDKLPVCLTKKEAKDSDSEVKTEETT